MRILVADDEHNLVDALRVFLTGDGYEVIEAHDGAEAFEQFKNELPDLVILDIMMPRLDGFETCEKIRAIDPSVPVLMLSAKGDIVDKRVGFRAGADDYLVKPFNEEELLLHVAALLRRARVAREAVEAAIAGVDTPSDTPSRPGLTEPVIIGDLTINPLRHEVTVRGKKVNLTPNEFRILALMADHPGQVFTKDELIEFIWGAEYKDEAVSIPYYVRHIREKIEEDPSDPRYLLTVWRLGYRLGE